MSKQVMKVFICDEAKKRIVDVLDSGWTGEGEIAKAFEEKLTNYVGKPGCLVNSGTSALELAYHCADLDSKYDIPDVICTPMTCAATTMPLARNGNWIHWVDVDRDGCVNIEDLRQQVIDNPKIGTIIVMDFGGMPCDWDEIAKIAKEYDLNVIGDCAQSIGSTYNGKQSASFPDFSMISFQSVKVLTCVDGGIMFASQKEVDRAKKLRWFGIDRFNRDKEKTWEYDIAEAGYKFNISDILAVIGLENLKYLDKHVEHHRKIASIYDANLPQEIVVKPRGEKFKSNYWMYHVLVEDRIGLIKKLKENKIGCGIGHNDNRTYSCITASIKRELPGVDMFFKNHLILPIHFDVTAQDAYEICEVINKG